MIDKILKLRNKLHKDAFRFNLKPVHWESHYISERQVETGNVIKVEKGGVLKGYAICSLLIDDQVRIFKILEVCADERDTFTELLSQLVMNAEEQKADFIIFKTCDDTFRDIFHEKEFLEFLESAVMLVLLNPQALLESLSGKIERGKDLELMIKGFDPILIRVGKTGIMVAPGIQPKCSLITDGKTFLKLFFGKTSFLKEALSGKISITNFFYMPTALHFFDLIKNEKWYIPPGDWR